MGRLIDADLLPLDKIDDANYGSNYIRIAPTVEAIPRERIEWILADIHKNAIILQEHGFDSVAIDAFEIMVKATIHKYTKEQNDDD